jgi:alpha-beta hydrolase superfamily lysophospholipase
MLYKEKFGTPSKGWVIVVHGLGEHSKRYHKLISMLNNEGYAVYAFDWPGHGRSDGKRGHSSIDEGIKIIKELIEEIGQKPFLFGHSLGAITSIRYAEKYPDSIKGIVVSAPPMAHAKNVTPFHVFVAYVVGSIFPRLTTNNRLNPHDFSRDEDAVQRYIDDPLVHDRISGSLTKTLFSNLKKGLKEADSLKAPILVLVGTADRVAPIHGAKQFMTKLQNKDKELKEFKGAYHEVFEDPEWAEAFHTTIVDWIKKH